MKLTHLNPVQWKKSYLFSLLAAFLVIWFSFIDVYSVKTRWELAQQKKELIKKTEDLAAKTELLQIKMNSLEKDPALLEKIAREEYGMRKPGETVYKIKKD